MSIKWMTWVFEHSKARGAQRLVLLALADNANDDGACWPSLATICKKAQLSKTTVSEALNGLEKSGVIARKRRMDALGDPATTYYNLIANEQGVVNTGEQPCQPVLTGVVNTGEQGVVNTGELKPSFKPSINHHVGGRKSAAKPPAPSAPKDARIDHPAVQAVRNVTKKFPNKAVFDLLISAIGSNPDIPKLNECYTEWIKRGYNPNATTWAVEWYTGGMPEQYKPKQKSAEPPDKRNRPVKEF